MQEKKENIIQIQGVENEENIDIRAVLEQYLMHWSWFVLGAILSLSSAFIYLRYATPQYSVSGAIMIKDNNKSGISSELAAFEDLGIIGGKSANNTDNEIFILKSRKIIGNVVDSLGLRVSYFLEGSVKKTEAYKSAPVFLEFINNESKYIEKDTAFVVSILDEYNFEFKNFSIEGLKSLYDQGFLLFVVSNQSGVAKGLVTKKDVRKFNNKMKKDLAAEGVEVVKFYTSYSSNENSIYRKPNNKFAEIISDNYKIALKESWVIGDKDSDILFGKLSNCKTIRISSSYTKEDKSNYFVNNLLEASNKILNHS